MVSILDYNSKQLGQGVLAVLDKRDIVDASKLLDACNLADHAHKLAVVTLHDLVHFCNHFLCLVVPPGFVLEIAFDGCIKPLAIEQFKVFLVLVSRWHFGLLIA